MLTQANADRIQPNIDGEGKIHPCPIATRGAGGLNTAYGVLRFL